MAQWLGQHSLLWTLVMKRGLREINEGKNRHWWLVWRWWQEKQRRGRVPSFCLMTLGWLVVLGTLSSICLLSLSSVCLFYFSLRELHFWHFWSWNVWVFFFFPRPSNSLQHQLGVLQLNSVLTQSSWMPYRLRLVRYCHPHFRCQMQLVGLHVTGNFCLVLLQIVGSHHPFLGFD